MKIFKISIILVSFLSVIIFERCVSDTINLDDISDDATRAYSIDVPGGTIRGSVMDIFEELDSDSIIEVDEDGLLWFYYEQEFTQNWQDVLTLNTISGGFYFDLSPYLIAAPLESAIRVQYAENIVLTNEQDVRLDTIQWKDGDFGFTFETSSSAIDSVIITIPQLYVNDEVYTDTLTASAFNTPYSLDLTNCLMDFTKNDGELNSISLITDVILKEDANTYSSADLSVSYELGNLGLDKAIGYFGTRIITDENKDVEFDAFDYNFLSADLALKDLVLQVNAENSFGIPVEIYSSDILFTNTDTNEEKDIVIEDDSNIIYLENYKEGSSEVPATTFELNSDNSNIEDLFNISDFAPNKVSSHIQIISNPNDYDEGFFITDTSTVKTSIKMNVPLWFKTSNYTRMDTIAFNYNEDINDEDEDESLSDNLQSLSVNFDVENGLPFDIKLQVYFTDENYIKVDSLFTSEDDVPFIESAVLDDSDRYSASTTSSFEAEINSDKLELWEDKDVKYAIIKLMGVTDDEDYVKLCTDNFINITLSLSAEGKLGE